MHSPHSCCSTQHQVLRIGGFPTCDTCFKLAAAGRCEGGITDKSLMHTHHSSDKHSLCWHGTIEQPHLHCSHSWILGYSHPAQSIKTSAHSTTRVQSIIERSH